MSEVLYRRTADLLEADLGDELVALDEARGHCLGFNDVAATVWRALVKPTSLGELVDQLTHTYDVSVEECEGDVQELLDDLIERKLVARMDRHTP